MTFLKLSLVIFKLCLFLPASAHWKFGIFGNWMESLAQFRSVIVQILLKFYPGFLYILSITITYFRSNSKSLSSEKDFSRAKKKYHKHFFLLFKKGTNFSLKIVFVYEVFVHWRQKKPHLMACDKKCSKQIAFKFFQWYHRSIKKCKQ